MNRLLTIASKEDILPQYRETPIGLLLEYHNLGRDLDQYTNAELLVGMCMDNRKHLHAPGNFAWGATTRKPGSRKKSFSLSS